MQAAQAGGERVKGTAVPGSLGWGLNLGVNYQPLLDKTISDLANWTALPLSLIGRVNTIKMVVLSKCLYLFQCFPIKPPKNALKR